MTAAKFRADYAQLDKIATLFRAQGAVAQQTLRDLQAQMRVLQSGDWIGRGANRFYDEMQSSVLPGQRRLVEALREAASATDRINHIAQQAERDAAVILDKAPGEGKADVIGLGQIDPLPVPTPPIPASTPPKSPTQAPTTTADVWDFDTIIDRIKNGASASEIAYELAKYLASQNGISATWRFASLAKLGKLAGKVLPALPWILNYAKYADEGGLSHPQYWADSLIDSAQGAVGGAFVASGMIPAGIAVYVVSLFLDMTGRNDEAAKLWVSQNPRVRSALEVAFTVQGYPNAKAMANGIMTTPEWLAESVPKGIDAVRRSLEQLKVSPPQDSKGPIPVPVPTPPGSRPWPMPSATPWPASP